MTAMTRIELRWEEDLDVSHNKDEEVELEVEGGEVKGIVAEWNMEYFQHVWVIVKYNALDHA